MPYTYPRQLKGIGMSRMAANQEIENSYFIDTNKQGLDTLLGTDTNWERFSFVAKITASAVLETVSGLDVRWSYTLTRHVFPATTQQYNATTVDPDTLTFTGYNVYEWYNATGILGDGTDVANLPADTLVMPVTGIVFVTLVRTVKPLSGTDIVYLFERNNGYECAEGE